MKKILKLIIVALIFVTIDVKALDIKSNNAILYNTNNNEVLYQKNEDDKVQIASLTKIMTALITLENIKDVNEKVTLTKEDFKGLLEENLVTAGFISNETVTYNDLLYGLLLPSGADAAKALARLVAGTEENFIKKMNDKAKKLNLKNTNFSNVIGLDDENNYSTAKDVATLFNYALKNKNFKEIITTETYKTANNRLSFKNKIRKNQLVGDYILGGKTGTTDGAGLCLASIAQADDANFLLVTLGAPYDKKGNHNLEDASTIYKYYKENYSYQTIWNEKDTILTLKTKYIKKEKINFKAKNNFKAYLPNNIKKEDIKYEYKGIKLLTPNLKKGKQLGTLAVYYKDKLLKKEKIYLEEKLNLSILKVIEAHKIITSIVVIFIILILFIILKRKSNQKKKQKKKKI